MASSGLRPVSASAFGSSLGALAGNLITMLSVFANFTFIPYEP